MAGKPGEVEGGPGGFLRNAQEEHAGDGGVGEAAGRAEGDAGHGAQVECVGGRISVESERYDLDYEHGYPGPPADVLERVLIVASVVPLLVLAIVFVVVRSGAETTGMRDEEILTRFASLRDELNRQRCAI